LIVKGCGQRRLGWQTFVEPEIFVAPAACSREEVESTSSNSQKNGSPSNLVSINTIQKEPAAVKRICAGVVSHIKSLSADVILSAAKDPGAEDAASLDVSLRST